jgi:hypothetical protein
MAINISTPTTGAIGATPTSSFAVSPTTGQSVVVCFQMYCGTFTAASTCADNQSNTYNQVAVSNQVSTASVRTAFFIAENIGTPSGTFTVTVTSNGVSTNEGMVVALAFDATTGVFDVSAASGATSQSGGFSPSPGTTASTAQANELILAALIVDSGQNPAVSPTPDPPSGWTNAAQLQNGTVHVPCRADYKEVSATGTQTITWASLPDPTVGGGSGLWSGLIGTFRETAAGGGPPTFMGRSIWMTA